ncbi:DNA primase [Alkalibacterium subtropicum]|uniref:DNA primase n=1 Tax=Alkalibacterium subtropicum TaxID=753702 RepID=A0A1I1JW39_9LACT|nr:DNA primase [Alkalibacterium subtropicum]SFC52736.1 DNA primase [Alkalibacterium subtropicum]
MSRIPDETINSIREQTDIVQVISQYLQLRKSGQNHFASCPFHDDKTPSFSVSEKKQIYHCFSCGRGGNVFSFLQEIEGISFVEAVGKTAELSEIPVDQTLFDQAVKNRPNADSTRGKLLSVYEKAEHFYHHVLVNTKAGEAAYQYLLDRGMTEESIDTFKIGFSPPQREALKMYLENEGLSEAEILKKTGLFSDRDDDTFYDRFTNRILFPIKDDKGHTVAFSGRAFMDNEDGQIRTAKYMNSPETELFNKRRVLFNYDKARPVIRREGEVLLFEGFMDVISAWQAGVRNGLATMGTSLTEEQVHTLDKVTDHVVIAYDGDSAGLDAIKRATDFITNETHFSIEIAAFPEKMDPDDFIQKKGAEAFKDFLAHGRDTLMSFLMKYHKKEVNLNNESDRLKYIDTVLNELTRVTSAVEREMYLNQLAETFDLSTESLKEQMHGHIIENQKERRKQQKKRTERQQVKTPEQPTVVLRQNKPKQTAAMKAENALLYRLFTDNDVWQKLNALDKELAFSVESNQLLFILYEEFYHSHDHPNVQSFIDFLPDEKLKSRASEIMWLSLSEDIAPGEIEDYLNLICNRQPLEDRIKNKREELVDAQRAGDKQRQQSLSIEIINLYRQLKNK